VGAAGVVVAGHDGLAAERGDGVEDPRVVGGDDHPRQPRGAPGGLDDVPDQGLPGVGQEGVAGESGGSVPGREDRDNFHISGATPSRPWTILEAQNETASAAADTAASAASTIADPRPDATGLAPGRVGGLPHSPAPPGHDGQPGGTGAGAFIRAPARRGPGG